MKKRTFWSSDINEELGTDEEIRENYQESMDKSDEEMKEITDGQVYDWANETVDLYFDDLKAEICSFENKNGKEDYLIIADLGLWNGHKKGGKVVKGLWSAITACFEDYNTIYEERGCLKIKAIHHDGTNYFTIYRLSDKGKEYYERNGNWMSREGLCETLRKPIYRRNVNLWEKLYE